MLETGLIAETINDVFTAASGQTHGYRKSPGGCATNQAR